MAAMEPRVHGRTRVVSIVGGRDVSPPVLAVAQAIGRGLVDAGYRIATGGMTGVMEAASRGGRESPNWREGMVVGMLPSLDPSQANPYVDIAIPTGLNIARNTLLVAMADVVVAIAGGAGTLSEIALAWQLNKPVVALDLGEGWSAELAGRRLDGRDVPAIVRATTAQEVVQAVGQAKQPAPPRFAWTS